MQFLVSHDPIRNPVAMKKKELLQESDPVRVLSPRYKAITTKYEVWKQLSREKMKLRKQQKADLQAAEIA